MKSTIENIKKWLSSNGLVPKTGISDEELMNAAFELASLTNKLQQIQDRRELNEIKRNSGLDRS